MHRLMVAGLVVSFLMMMACGRSAPPAPEESVADRARRIHMAALVVDTHADTPTRMMYDGAFDIGRRDTAGHIDIPRMREGGLDAVFFSIWVPTAITGRPAVEKATQQIELVRVAAEKYPQDLALATTVEEVRRAHEQKKIATLMGLEGGHMINDSLDQLRKFAASGVRYMTLTHSKNTNWADSSGETPKHNGLTAFGKDVVREMNKLGVMVDISHVSDKTFADVLETTRAPVIASHSSCRVLSSHARNMSDDMIRALASNGGVMMINYHVQFLDEANYAAAKQNKADWDAIEAEIKKKCGDNTACAIFEDERIRRERMQSGKEPRVNWEKIVEHIDHVVKLVGADHVGLGSDFDGATMPFGMENVTKLPAITEALLRRGYSEQDIGKILGGNLLRVMGQVEKVAREMQTQARR